ncbi:hypothetical protein CLOSTMETH_01063 [[Clostridium] methylpentosum DSM 5476]|uniref:Uncharacterized protein n=1 Tax=[Clostridium] methylpentosum DSM 5476 TaxID=537013 RepID=C0EB46_9FIRM|nr:hypothetical protein CLOSTMETH_01063 [[Clostridium] methylpentosum DSM 5476]
MRHHRNRPSPFTPQVDRIQGKSELEQYATLQISLSWAAGICGLNTDRIENAGGWD